MTAHAGTFHLALREFHASRGAIFRAHAGWWWPAHYGDAGAEHAAIRGSAAVLDRSPRSRFIVSGTDALDVLRTAFAGHLEDLEEGRAMRTVRLDAAGLVRDLVLVARIGAIAYLVSGEPGQRTETLAALRAGKQADYEVRIDDRTESTCLVALSGPAAPDIARAHLSEALPARLQLLHCVAFEFHGFRALAVRTSDVGEDGFEFMLAPSVARHVFETLAEAGVAIAGLDAQEIARIEACVPAYDPDLAPGLSPGEAELDTLLELPPGRARWLLTAVLIEEGHGEPGTPLVRDGSTVGEIRSVAQSPALGTGVALAIVEARHAVPGRTLDAGGRRATIVAKPILRRRH